MKKLKNLNKLETISEKNKNSNQKYYYYKHLFYGNIEKAIKENNLSYQEIADKINYRKKDLEAILSIEPNLTLKKMVKLADAVGLNIIISYTKRE